ncbi:MAG: galactose mutarotase [Clostridiaceae bacterium]|nr:galactose mutarotase [Clostridiaceae bacterium]
MISKKYITEHKNKEIYLYHFKNESGSEMKVTNYGAIITSIKMPDRDGFFDEVSLGYEDVSSYIKDNPFYFGCIIGRYANRIKNGRFTLNNINYQLTTNEGKNQLHGGHIGFHQRTWEGRVEEDVLILSYLSPDGEELYPGTVQIEVKYQLTNENEIIISYEGVSDKDTIINLTNHSYFNLNGSKSAIFDHELFIDADYFTPTDEELIPTGELRHVEGTAFDFRESRKIGERIFDFEDEAISIGNGYDHNYVLNGSGLRKVAEVNEQTTGRCMEVFTNQPGMQFFTAHIIHPNTIGSNNNIYEPYYGICLEPQVHPDSPNKDHFPNCVLRRGETYHNETIYKFSAK